MQEQLFRGVVEATPRTLVAALLAAWLLAWTASEAGSPSTDEDTHAWRVWVWFLLLVIVLTHGLHTAVVRRRQATSAQALVRLARHYTWGSYACAALWGAVSWVLLPAAAPWANVVILVGMSMVTLGAAAAMAGFRPAVYIHVTLMAGIFAAGLFRTLEPDCIAYGVGFLLLGATAASSAHRQERALTGAIAGQLRVAALLEQLRGEQLQAEAARREAVAAHEEAERAHAAKTVFMAAASHDLRQPVHALTQYVAAISRLNVDPRLAASIAGASHAIDSMGDLLKAVMEISKLMSGAVTPRPDVFVLDDWAARQVSELEPLAQAKRLAVHVFIQAGLLVCTDRVLLDRVVRNLLHNAVTYTAQGRVVIHVSRRGEVVRVRVADTGAGIHLADRARVFEPFFQVANPGRNRAHGLGLGLAIVRELTQLLGLQLRLTSRPGRGSVFTLFLPICPDRRRLRRHASPMQELPPHNHVAGALLVLIDDDDMSLRATEATLLSFGCDVIAGHDADQVLARLAVHSVCPQLIVSDYRLENTTGLDAVARLHAHCAAAFGPQACPPVLIVSGETSPDELARVHAAGALMLHKPVRPALLFKHLNEALHQRSRPTRGDLV